MKRKAILVGNGFSSQLIPEFGNNILKKRLLLELPNLVTRLDNLWTNIFLLFEGQYGNSGIGFLYPEFSGLHLDDADDFGDMDYNIVVDNLKKYKHNFDEMLASKYAVSRGTASRVYDKYFVDFYSCLRHQVYYKEIVGIEPFYALSLLAFEMKLLSSTELFELEMAIKRTLRNNEMFTYDCVDPTRCVKESLDASNNSAVKCLFVRNANAFLSQFQFVYTTNYDCLLESFTNMGIRHLHGTFAPYQQAVNVLHGDKKTWIVNEDIILGVTSEQKRNAMDKTGHRSINTHYLNTLKSSRIDEIHIWGYSGINDQHINQCILENAHIETIYYYGNPKKINDPLSYYEQYINYCLGNGLMNSKKKLILKSWDEVWNQLYV